LDGLHMMDSYFRFKNYFRSVKNIFNKAHQHT